MSKNKVYNAEPTYGLDGKFNSWDIRCDSRTPIATREMNVYVRFHEGKIIFKGAWIVAHGESYSYKEGERDDFDRDYKGLLKNIQEKNDNKKISFWVYDENNELLLNQDEQLALKYATQKARTKQR